MAGHIVSMAFCELEIRHGLGSTSYFIFFAVLVVYTPDTSLWSAGNFWQVVEVREGVFWYCYHCGRHVCINQSRSKSYLSIFFCFQYLHLISTAGLHPMHHLPCINGH
jgi:hypothetical protein